MACLFCRRKIGPLRRFADANFCSAEHRKKYRANSARALREAEDLYGSDEEWSEQWRLYSNKSGAKPHSPASQSGVVVVLLAVAFLIFAMTRGRGDGGAAPSRDAANDENYSSSTGKQSGKAIEKGGSVTIRESFSSGLSKWEAPPDTKATDWSTQGGYVRPGRLRVWKDSESLSNYDMEFLGHIEKKSMDWAFRAADFKNYYATKLTLGGSGPMPNTGLVRYAVIDGKERDRVEVPLPIRMEANTDYRVKVSVRGGRFLTSIDGQLVSSWSDKRISRGGIGLFADAGESSAVKWVSVSEQDSFWQRVRSHFSFMTVPGITVPGMPQEDPFAR
jgi:hypothetical protein